MVFGGTEKEKETRMTKLRNDPTNAIFHGAEVKLDNLSLKKDIHAHVDAIRVTYTSLEHLSTKVSTYCEQLSGHFMDFLGLANTLFLALGNAERQYYQQQEH